MRVAILIDGDNVSATHASRIAALGKAAGRVEVHHAYADATNGSGWNAVPGVRLVHAGGGKNAADLLLSIDAMEMAVTSSFDTMLIASSDGDFTHLATRLRQRGICVIGVGETKAPGAFRAACTRFETLPRTATAQATKVPGLDLRIRAMIAENGKLGKGMRVTDLNARMRARHAIRISTYPEKTWRAYLAARPTLYDLDPRGPDAHVRFRPAGFAD